MSNIFKTIRKSNLMANNSKKYFKYAIREIILLVIGIIIALQINNWNEARKLKQEEVKLLRQIKQDLVDNNNEILELEKRLSINKNGVDSLLARFKNNNNDKLLPIYTNMIHRKVYFNNSNTGYNLILNNSTSIISNDTILKSILELFEKDFPDILKRQELMHQKIENHLYPLTNSLFKVKPMTIKFKELDAANSDLYEPIDFKALTKNNLYKNTLLQLKRTFEERLILSEKSRTKIEQILKIITQELNQ